MTPVLRLPFVFSIHELLTAFLCLALLHLLRRLVEVVDEHHLVCVAESLIVERIPFGGRISSVGVCFVMRVGEELFGYCAAKRRLALELPVVEPVLNIDMLESCDVFRPGNKLLTLAGRIVLIHELDPGHKAGLSRIRNYDCGAAFFGREADKISRFFPVRDPLGVLFVFRKDEFQSFVEGSLVFIEAAGPEVGVFKKRTELTVVYFSVGSVREKRII
jgi:hypothetical protein